MKILLLPALALLSTAHAEVIECPSRYPAQEIKLEQGRGRVQPARLSFAYMHIGELHGNQELQGPEPRKVKGGWDTAYDFLPGETRWLVCIYGGTEWSGLDRISAGTIQWWGKVAPTDASCLLKVRETRMHGALSDWTATVTCDREKTINR